MIFEEKDKERKLLRDQGIIVLTGHVDSVMATIATQDILLLANKVDVACNDITIVMNSPGGDVESGLGIVASIRYAQSKGVRVVGKVYGHAMSMMLDILQTCDERVVSEHSWLMVHGMRSAQETDMKGSEEYMEYMKGLTTQSAQVYAEKNTSDEEQYHKADYWYNLMKTDHPNFLSADQALFMGLVDNIE